MANSQLRQKPCAVAVIPEDQPRSDPDTKVRLDLRTYENPRPDVEVTSIDFVSKMTFAAPFLVAMTVER